MELNQIYRLIEGRPRYWIILNGERINKITDITKVPTEFYFNKIIKIEISVHMLSFHITEEIHKENYDSKNLSVSFKDFSNLIDKDTKIKCDAKFIQNPDLYINKIYFESDWSYFDIY